MARCLCRPMSIVLIACISPFVLCNGERTQNALPRPFYVTDQSPGWRCVGVFDSTCYLDGVFSSRFLPFDAKHIASTIEIHYFLKHFGASKFHDSACRAPLCTLLYSNTDPDSNPDAGPTVTLTLIIVLTLNLNPAVRRL